MCISHGDVLDEVSSLKVRCSSTMAVMKFSSTSPDIWHTSKIQQDNKILSWCYPWDTWLHESRVSGTKVKLGNILLWKYHMFMVQQSSKLSSLLNVSMIKLLSEQLHFERKTTSCMVDCTILYLCAVIFEKKGRGALPLGSSPCQPGGMDTPQNLVPHPLNNAEVPDWFGDND